VALPERTTAVRSGCADIGDRQALEAFDRAHRQATWPLYVGTNALAALFTDERPTAKVARRFALEAAARMPVVSDLVKTIVTRQLMSGVADTRRRATLPRRLGLFTRLP